MDNFGIFKLLNSFLNNGTQNKDKSFQNQSNESADDQSVLNKLFSSLKGENNIDKPATNTNNIKNNMPDKSKINQTIKNDSAFLPLQKGMIEKMKNHDEFIRRVYENQKKAPKKDK